MHYTSHLYATFHNYRREEGRDIYISVYARRNYMHGVILVYSNKPVLRHAWVLRQTDISHSPVAPLPPNSLARCYNTFPGLKCRLLGYRMSPLFFLARIMVNLRANFVRLRHWSRSRAVLVAKFHLKLRLVCMHVIVWI